MKKGCIFGIIGLILGIILTLIVVNLISNVNKLTTEDCIGTWVLEDGNYDNNNILEIYKGGVAKTHEENVTNMYKKYTWEIKDNVFVLSGDNMTDSFEVNGNTMKSLSNIYGTATYTKNKN